MSEMWPAGAGNYLDRAHDPVAALAEKTEAQIRLKRWLDELQIGSRASYYSLTSVESNHSVLILPPDSPHSADGLARIIVNRVEEDPFFPLHQRLRICDFLVLPETASVTANVTVADEVVGSHVDNPEGSMLDKTTRSWGLSEETGPLLTPKGSEIEIYSGVNYELATRRSLNPNRTYYAMQEVLRTELLFCTDGTREHITHTSIINNQLITS
ncbi:MAG: hypothetical protein WBP26_04780 [Candidatus Saccharimonadales bacterium]